MRTHAEHSSADSSCILTRAIPLARAAAIAVAFASTTVLFAGASADLAPSSSGAIAAPVRAFAARQVSSKVDPVDALFPRAQRGLGYTVDPHSLPGTFVVKFRDEVKARFIGTSADGEALASLSGWDLDRANTLLRFYNASARRWLSRSESELAEIEARARDHSGKMQPDLAGMIRVAGVPTDRLLEAARSFSDLGEVEFVVFEQHAANLQQGCDPNNAADCELPAPSCDNPFPGTDDINRTECNPPAADPRIWGCNDVTCCEQVGDFDPTCGDEEDNNGWDVWCAAWANILCSGTIYEAKPDDGPYDPCFFDPLEPDPFIKPVFAPIFYEVQDASCLAAHSGRGCRQPACCNSICALDPTCCSEAWDASCANIALSGQISACTVPPDSSGGQSPDLTAQETPSGLQGYAYYTQGGPRPQQLEDTQNLGATWKGARNGGPSGFTGHGFALKEMEDFQNLIWENYQGGDPAANPYLKGGTIRIGVVESSGYTMHEDFILAGPAKNPTRPWEGPLLGEPKVTVETGQSPIFVEQGPISANHGTNVLGVILAADNGVGITGIASNASGTLYPSFDVMGGFRGQDAIASAIVDMRPGDVLNFSWGFRGYAYFNDRLSSELPVNPVHSNAAYSTVMGVASAAGIACVVAAGMGPVAIQGSSDIDLGFIIVTAVWPGNMTIGTTNPDAAPGYAACELDYEEEALSLIRYPTSNYAGTDAAAADEQPTTSAWGYAVATTGATTRFDNTTVPNPELFLFQGVNDAPPSDNAPNLQIDRLRLYTQDFGGTSSAAAMITGIVARMQASAKQYFGTPLMPDQIRNVLANHPGTFGQCPCATAAWFDIPLREGPPGVADSCAPPLCTGAACIPDGCACENRNVGTVANLQQLPATVLAGGAGDGNDVDVEVITGGRLVGYSWSSFQIRAADGNFLQINAERAQAGSTRRGLTYLSTGLTTDVRVTRSVDLPDPAVDLNGIAIRAVSQSTRNFVMAGIFIRNFESNRYEFIDAEFLTTAGVDATFDIPDSGSFARYVNPETNEVDVRIWTCGLGATGRHVVRHDLVEIVLNPPFEPL